jgi:hypothetical protein
MQIPFMQIGVQLRAGAVATAAAARVRWCCEASGVGGGWGCSGPVLSWSRDGGRVVSDGFGAHGAALASAFEDSMVVWWWWGDGDRVP